MPPTNASTIKLSDYAAPAYWVETVDLTFRLQPAATRVLSKIKFNRNLDRTAQGAHDLYLDGRNLTLISASIDGTLLALSDLTQDDEGLRIPHHLLPNDSFLWQAEVEVNPQSNTALEGLYMSNGMYCTQCEAQGFRKITFYPDRPDVMAVFTVRIESLLDDVPEMLSNGNADEYGSDQTATPATHYAVWHDPWPKPAYLFALVAGDLVSHDDTFVTLSGRTVDLRIFVRPGDENKCAYAMDALKRSMKWDEDVYGREYDLDLFMIVAVDDFNMGAMENKGLNVFNSKYVLASPETATDRDFELIEGIIAHEYFHNWTGNRITCRDWFQLCLKEGLTVFRDQQFSGDQRSHAVKRIDDVLQLRARQFREDAGPLAHPVRPEEYIEINNFYTATVYEKGAEVIGMLKLLVGDAAYDVALTEYFNRHDGQACTIEDWIKVFEDTTGRDLSQFALWYAQSGTPRLSVKDSFEDGTYTITFAQSNADSAGQSGKKPQVIPIRLGFLGTDGSEPKPEMLIEMTTRETTVSVAGFSQKPIPSILRGFSAPVIVDRDIDNQERAFLLAHDRDPFNKWEAGRDFAMDLLCDMASDGQAADPLFTSAMRHVALDPSLDPAFRALALTLPSDEALAQAVRDRGTDPDPLAIHAARGDLNLAIATALGEDLPALYHAMTVDGPYTPDAKAAGKRALKSTALSLLTKLDGGATAEVQFSTADNMTEQLSALATLIRTGHATEATAAFYEQWHADKLVMDKWFAIQAAAAPPDAALDTVISLSSHVDFDWKNPNRYRSLIGAFATNHAEFHRADGRGYSFVADWLIELDRINPQTTARLCGVFETWKRYDENRQALIKTQLQRISDFPNLSKDTSEIVGKILAA